MAQASSVLAELIGATPGLLIHRRKAGHALRTLDAAPVADQARWLATFRAALPMVSRLELAPRGYWAHTPYLQLDLPPVASLRAVGELCHGLTRLDLDLATTSTPELDWEWLAGLAHLAALQGRGARQMTALPDELVEHLCFLSRLELSALERLAALPPELTLLRGLAALAVDDCPRIDAWPPAYRGLSSLTSLRLTGIAPLATGLGTGMEPGALRQLHLQGGAATSLDALVDGTPELERLEICQWRRLASLFEWRAGWRHLQALKVGDCPSLAQWRLARPLAAASPASGSAALGKLSALEIRDCPGFLDLGWEGGGLSQLRQLLLVDLPSLGRLPETIAGLAHL